MQTSLKLLIWLQMPRRIFAANCISDLCLTYSLLEGRSVLSEEAKIVMTGQMKRKKNKPFGEAD